MNLPFWAVATEEQTRFILNVQPVIPFTLDEDWNMITRVIVPFPFVVLKQSGPWTVGALANQVWSFAGNSGRPDVSQLFVQPFLAYNTHSLFTFTLQSETTANWKADGDKWTVPINFLVSKLSSFGPFPASYALGFGVYAAHPDSGPTWKLRGVITVLLPRRK